MDLIPKFNLTPSTVSLSVACVLTGYLTSLSITPPNPNPEKQDVDDRLRKVLTDRTIRNRKVLYTALSLYHAVMVLVLRDDQPAAPTALCPWAESNLNRPLLFSWSAYVAVALGAVCLLGAPLRLASYGALGRNFTFHLQTPSELNTRGLYTYMQHPGYTGNTIVRAGCFAVFMRWDGVLGCWIPPAARAALNGFGWAAYLVLAVVMARAVMGRVADEEKMLKDKFGDTWVQWHKRTARFVPGIF
ncbi:hypothetical protein PV08_01350 [Exophiala spinifera]|uniref:Protein-S-isoprenylcysteine O-methyltransferase n=1 Tax=Exophiala spinifera TaxID=91928 RepID=A0A0D2A7K7_9EURO|nr:uncharacterized protein PV08_01350 [Exophiala spinifera]KIW20772.1 hypothetical protein PV08_01350 [Exophiala spinifera]